MSVADITAGQGEAARSGKILAFPVLIYLAVVMLPMGFNLGPLNLNGVRVVLMILIIPLAIRLVSGRCGPLLPTDIFFLLHILWLLIAMVMNNPEQTVTFFGSQAVEFVGGYLLGRVCIRSREDFVALCRLVVLLVCLTLPFAIIEAITGRALILEALNALPGIRSDPNVNAGVRFGLQRAQGSFDHPILYGLFSALIFPLAFVALKAVYSTTTRYVLSLLIGLCVFLSLSGGPLMAFVMQMILIGWAAAFDKVNARWWLLLAFAVFCYVVVDILSTRDPIRVFLTYATFSTHTAWNRINIFNFGMDNVWANPIFGLGLKDWARPFWMGSSMDNFWLVQAVRYGIPGFALIAGGYLIALWKIGWRDFD
ncbi:MAG: O-antigen ligase family protein, partial [Parvularcula sp.]|nr:O-antigen ligase family protein [Parvularcula sp.]